jgi:hypothetical protein
MPLVYDWSQLIQEDQLISRLAHILMAWKPNEQCASPGRVLLDIENDSSLPDCPSWKLDQPAMVARPIVPIVRVWRTEFGIDLRSQRARVRLILFHFYYGKMTIPMSNSQGIWWYTRTISDGNWSCYNTFHFICLQWPRSWWQSLHMLQCQTVARIRFEWLRSCRPWIADFRWSCAARSQWKWHFPLFGSISFINSREQRPRFLRGHGFRGFRGVLICAIN